MLSYQHIFHAGNLADVQKHAALAWVVAYLTAKDKPISYIETHSGRALYDLASDAAKKTGEAEKGIECDGVQTGLGLDHPYLRVLNKVRDTFGPRHYPGSPWIARELLRATDQMHLAELHPQEAIALRSAIGKRAKVYHQDGFQLAHSLCPPTPRRGLLLIDPSYEIKTEYATIPPMIAKLHKKWNVGVIMLWFPILTSGAHDPMLAALVENHPDGLRAEVNFPHVREGHRMVGSGLFIVNPPFGLADELKRIADIFGKLT